MKLVTFARPQAPHSVGDKRLVPDEVAARLKAEGAVSACEPWPDPARGHPPRKPARPVVHAARPVGARDSRRVS